MHMMPLPALDDVEGPRVPSSLPPVIDAHVHLFPDRLFDAIWRWFDEHGWPIRYKMYTPEVIEFLEARGVKRFVALHYAHKPGIARGLNSYMADVVRAHPDIVTGLATVFPGEPDAETILEDAFASGLTGVKLHCHVQCVAPDADSMMPLYELCARLGKPVILHSGREPTSAGYACDVHALCSADAVDRVMSNFPKLKLCIPHLGADEFREYGALLRKHDSLWLDTTMAIAGYLPLEVPRFLLDRPHRIMYGSDFPNLPFAWDRELKKLEEFGLKDDLLEQICSKTAEDFYGIKPLSG